MRALTVDWVTCSRSAALMKLPAAMTARKVRASSVSISAFRVDTADIIGHNISFVKCIRYANLRRHRQASGTGVIPMGAVLKNNSWIWLLSAFAVLIVVGIFSS
jgi:hypothetical protein